MRYKVKEINIILLFGVLTIFSSCNGQNTSGNKNSTLKNQNIAASIGDTVSEMEKKVMVIFQDKNDHYWFGVENKEHINMMEKALFFLL